VNIGSPHFPGEHPLAFDDRQSPPRSAENASPLRDFEQNSSLDSLRPLLGLALHLLDDAHEQSALPGCRVINAVSESLVRLQDAFLESLATVLAVAGDGHKLTLRLDADARLVVGGDHPEATRLRDMLDGKPELAEAFAEIAVQSALLRDLRNLQNTALYATSRDRYMAHALSVPKYAYQMSVKGEMSHFYFSR
jgi:hypothetical protein